MHHEHHSETLQGVEFWESHYAKSNRVWSGRVNQVIEQLVSPLIPGTALDLGCGEGGDVLWLAKNGWKATGVDISPTAVQRARAEAEQHGLNDGRTRFIAADLADFSSEQRFDLVSMSFFQAPFEFPRAELLRKAACMVAPQGHLLLLSHAAMPPWASYDPEHHGSTLPTPESELRDLNLDPTSWRVLKAEVIQRQTTGPDGVPASLQDTVVFIQRTR